MWLWRAALAVALLGGGGAQDALVTEGLAVTLLGGGPPPDRPVVRGLACGSRLVGRYISDFSACRASILQATGADLRLDSTSYFAFGGIYGTCVACTELEFRYALDNRDEFASGFSVGTFDVYSVGPRPPAPMPPPAPLSPPPVSLEPVTVFTYVGCYKDSWHARDLATPADSARPSTIESCGEACGALGALFFGLQAGPCSCGDDVGTDPRAHEKLNDAECGAPCPGDEGAQPTSMPKGAARQPLDAPRPCGAKGRNAAYRINVISAPSSPPPPAKPCLDNDETFTKLSHGFSCAQSTSHCLEGTMGWNIVRKLCPLSCTVALRRGCKDEKGEQHEKVEWTAPGCAEVAEAIESGAPIPGVLPPSAPSHSAPAKPAAPARPSRGSRASESSSSPSPAAPAPSPADSEVEPAKRPRGRHPSPAPPPPAPPPAAPPRPERSGATRRHGSDGDGDGDGGKGRHPAAAAATAPVRAEHPARLRAGARGQQRHVGWVGCYSVAKSELRASVGLGLGTSGCARSCSAFPYFAMQGGACFCEEHATAHSKNETKLSCAAECASGGGGCCGRTCEGEEGLSPPRCCGEKDKHAAIYSQLDHASYERAEGSPAATRSRLASATLGCAALVLGLALLATSQFVLRSRSRRRAARTVPIVGPPPPALPNPIGRAAQPPPVSAML